MTTRLVVGIIIASCLLSMASSVLAFVFSLRTPPRRFWPSVLLACIAMAIGYVGFDHWTPFSFFPQIGYTWSSDSFQFSFASNWFFAAPLLLGTIGLLLAIWKR